MKRSTTISLVLLASVSAVASLSGCDQAPASPPDNGGTFASKAECVAVYDQATCDAADKLARQEHLQNAPKFGDQASCAAQYGTDMCQPASAYGGSGNQFMPLMIGYMMGSMNSTPAPLYYGAGSYRDRDRPGYQAPVMTSGYGYNRSAAIGRAPFASTRPTISGKAGLNSTTAMTPPSSVRGGFGSSFKPTSSFTNSYARSNPSSFGARSSFSSGSSFHSSPSVSARGGFGSMGRGFGGGFGG